MGAADGMRGDRRGATSSGPDVVFPRGLGALEAPTVELREPAVVVASWRELLVIVWLGRGGADVVRGVVAQQRSFARRLRGRKMALITVVRGSSIQLPDGATRAMVDAVRRDLAAVIKAEAVVLPSSGFATAAIRSIIAGMMLFHQPAYPTRVLDALGAAFVWLAPYLDPADGRALTPAEVAAAYAGLGVPAPG